MSAENLSKNAFLSYFMQVKSKLQTAIQDEFFRVLLFVNWNRKTKATYLWNRARNRTSNNLNTELPRLKH